MQNSNDCQVSNLRVTMYYMKTTTINMRTTPETKHTLESMASSWGVSMSSALELIVAQVKKNGGIELTYEPSTRLKKSIKRSEDSHAKGDVTTVSDKNGLDTLFANT